jgi:trehalose 6-phosphate synthase/phosphatase
MPVEPDLTDRHIDLSSKYCDTVTYMERLLIVSNRLPVSATVAEGQVRLTTASGGLATGLRPWHERTGGLWIGWPGALAGVSPDDRAAVDRELAARAIVPVHLSHEQVERYYHGFANRVLWPLFHYLIDRVPVDAAGWEAYTDVNRTFAEAVAREYRTGDTIWVHDYQLMLLPAMLRERLPEARIGFFLHIPFPSSEVFRVLPWRRHILDGLLGADLIGVHTFSYMRHFIASLLHVESVEADVDRVRVGDRVATVGVFPMGIDAEQFATLARDPGVHAHAAAIRRDAGGRRIILGVDRLDYTKGIPRRLHAIERLLAREPALADTVRFIQVAVPSRGEVDSYQKFKRQVEEAVGRINGACGTLRSTPVQYVHQSVSMRELVALYSAADVMLVTPLRDGMNLVAKEFVASRGDDDGVLVLSEFAGAAAELDGAVVVNPYDVEAVAASIRHALVMPAAERRARMHAMRRRVADADIHAWASGFLDRLRSERPAPPQACVRPEPALIAALADARRAAPLRLLLDYDGTLVPLARAPELAAPDAELLELLTQLATAPAIAVEIVSGRARDALDTWFGHLPVRLWSEHGFWQRRAPDAPWTPAASIRPDWAARILPILQQFTDATPGSALELKTASIAWHFRRAQRDFGTRQAHELRMLLGDALSNQPIEVLEGKKVIEVRLRGISKSLVAQDDSGLQPQITIAFGDDQTDAELFRALPPSSITVAVGEALRSGRYRLAGFREVRSMLRTLLDAPSAAADHAPSLSAASVM